MRERDLANHILNHFGMSNNDQPDLAWIAQIQGINVQYVPWIEGMRAVGSARTTATLSLKSAATSLGHIRGSRLRMSWVTTS